AVVQGARGLAAARRREERVARDRSRELDRRVRVDAPRVVAPHGAPDAAAPLDLDDRYAVRVLRQANVLKALRHRLAEQMAVRAELVVDDEETAAIAVRSVMPAPPPEPVV